MRSERYQIALILLGIIAAIFFGVFFYRELFPEYRIYQNDYVALEKFRSTYTGEPPPAFREGVKQIVFDREDKGPPSIDRCTSCHVALQLPHFSPVKISRDSSGAIIRDADGIPLKEKNEEYIWAKLDRKIADLTDSKVNEQLNSEGLSSKVAANLKQAAEYEALKTAHVGEHVYDVTKVLAMHPLIGKETRPFEFHPIEEYGCTICHSGNGKGLTTDKAHGPVFDGKYETEYMGPEPEFLQHDPENDPRFAQVFNHKPADALLFQTSPLLVGSLIQAKCVQCHKQGALGTQKIEDIIGDKKNKQNEIDKLTKDYHRGEQLYISQACYACHRIAGFSRGGVGPELTRAGGLYPWYIKEKITWPQGTLKTSTMPNMRLDHVEVEDLMTFLLGQKGPTQAISQMDYKTGIQEWEAGKRQDWEQPISPTQMHDLHYAMTVFATEGCAACHKLKGFESNVGFRIEKSEKAQSKFDALNKEHAWFQKLFPEAIEGTEIVKVIEQHGEEIDQHIVGDVREHALLDELEKKHPGLIESFYSPFQFALRAKNHQYKESAESNADLKAKESVSKQQEQWQKRVRHVLMMYVQEYGLGRLIGPRPNWSGVYRSDEWLMEHFKNPTSHVPNSIMPVFPFDESKFYALTYMLDVLGKRNRDEVKAIWENFGFNPGQAFQIYCSQCHGDYLQGNGPVSPWIYPIPKNLRNAEFLRNLTKEKAFDSIAHGVKGTPMAPWAETPKDKYEYDGMPVLNTEQINLLVDWLYSSLPGATVIKTSEDVPKWQYSEKNIIDELHHVGINENPFEEHLSSPQHLYIKKKLYTPENLEQGKQFFEKNCAVCHGKEADGAGTRSSIMMDAKPRMLINLDWLQSRDDLRLLRSIKYGVPGTSMTPWGDLTNPLQRLQLVMFIRSLSQENALREQLTESLYYTFASPLEKVESSRIEEYAKLESTKNKLAEIAKEQEAVLKETNPSSEVTDKAVDNMKQQLLLTSTVRELQANDQKLLDLKKLIKRQEDLFREMGIDLLRAEVESADWNKFITILRSNAQSEAAKSNLTLEKELIASYEDKVKQIQHEKTAALGRIVSTQRSAELKSLDAQISTYVKTQRKLTEGFKEIEILQKQKEETFKSLKASQIAPDTKEKK